MLPAISTVAPTNYDQLFRDYYPYVKNLIVKYGVPYDQAEDVAMILLEKVIQHDLLNQFDDERIGTNGRPVHFKTFFSGFILSYVRHLVDRINKSTFREPQYVDLLVREGENKVAGSHSWLDARGFVHEDDLTLIEYEMLLSRIRVHLSTLPVRRKKNFSLLFDLMLMQVDDTGKLNKRELSGLFEVSESLVSSWVKQLSEHIKAVL